MLCSSSSTRSSSSRSSRRGRSRPLALILLACAALVVGCGEDESAEAPAGNETGPEAEGTLRIAVNGTIGTLDPLATDSRAERLAARQIYEPPISRQTGPFGQPGSRPGLIRAIRPVDGGRVWVATLRPGVRFGNGEALDADAVIANAGRWIASRDAAELVPGLMAVDSPRPGRVRFLLGGPDPRFAKNLADARLGIVAPELLSESGGAVRIDADGGGTGPFEVREREGDRTLLARRASWWGARLGLGPGVDQIELVRVPNARERADSLRAGTVDVADGLRGAGARVVRADPLLGIERGARQSLGYERSVRGIASAAADQPLAGVWLTDLR